MGRPTRHFDPDLVYRVTNSTLPHRTLAPGGVGPRNRMGIWLVRALEAYPVELFGVTTLPDGYVWLLRGPDDETVSAFVGYVQGNVARALNQIQGHPHERLWSTRRFKARPVRPGAPTREALVDLLTLPWRLGYVGHPRDWPLLSSYPELVLGSTRAFAWMDRTGWHRAGKPHDDTRWWSAAPLVHARLSGFDRRALAESVERRLSRPRPLRRDPVKPFRAAALP